MVTETQKKGNGNEQAAAEGPQFAIQRIYVKDVSFETPNAPDIFKEQWEPKVHIDLHTENKKLDDKVYEVILSITVTVKVKDETVAFVAEVKQAGIFSVDAFPDDQIAPLLGSFCPNILFPYVREAITALVSRGGFPQIYLAPINFDAIYQQQLKQQKEKEEGQA